MGKKNEAGRGAEHRQAGHSLSDVGRCRPLRHPLEVQCLVVIQNGQKTWCFSTACTDSMRGTAALRKATKASPGPGPAGGRIRSPVRRNPSPVLSRNPCLRRSATRRCVVDSGSPARCAKAVSVSDSCSGSKAAIRRASRATTDSPLGELAITSPFRHSTMFADPIITAASCPW